MAVNRYNLPAQQPIMNTYAPLPFKELLLAGKSMQDQKDKIEEQRLELAGKEFQFLDADYDKAKAKRDYYDTELEKAAGLYGTDLRQARAATEKLSREFKRDFSQFGEVGAIQGSYDTRAKYVEELDERIKAGKADPLQKQKLLEYFDKEYKGIGEPSKGRYKTYQTEDAATHINPAEWANKYGEGFKADLQSFANYEKTSDGYIITDKYTGKKLTPQEIQAGLSSYFKGDPELQNWLRQGNKVGYGSLDMLIDAIEGAGIKYGFSEVTTDKDMKGDPNYQYNQEKASQASVLIPDYQEKVTDELTDLSGKIKTNKWGLPVGVIKGEEIFTEAEKVTTQEIERINTEMDKLDAAKESASTPEQLKSIEENLMSLMLQKGAALEKIKQQKEIKEGVIKNTYNITDEELAEKGFDNVEDYIREKENINREYKTIVSQKVKYDNDLQKAKQQLLGYENARTRIEFDSKGNAKVKAITPPIKPGAVYSPVEVDYSEVKEMVSAYNALKGSFDDEINAISSKVIDKNNTLFKEEVPSNFNEAFTNLTGSHEEFISKSSLVNDNLDYYVNNRTITAPLVMLSPDKIKKSGFYSTLEGMLATDLFKFTRKDAAGNDVPYNKKDVEYNFKDGLNATSTPKKITLSGYKIDINSGDIKLVANSPEGHLVETKVPAGSNIVRELNKEAEKELTNSIQENTFNTGKGMQTDWSAKDIGDKLTVYAATSPEANVQKIYEDTRNVIKDLTETVASGDPNKLIIRGVSVPGEGQLYISVDNVSGTNPYNIYPLGTTLSEIQSKKADFQQISAEDLLPNILGNALLPN